MVEEERWVMHGLSADDPDCIKSVEQLQNYIEEIGFLPLFRNEIPGFSVEEHTASDSWWSEDPARDPWEWRKILAGIMSSGYLTPEDALKLLMIGPEYTQVAVKTEKAAKQLRFIRSEKIKRIDGEQLKAEQDAYQETFALELEKILER